ncbi:hypothetical protein [Sulfurimonas sp. HSL3-7]|uniref:hypothetical protein n=1 Tax=Sulfonitrofixus jiaomeiensis TaxID=3131938 RepID=UPI0031F90335
MKHSFIAPRRKKIIGAELKWLFAAFLLLLLVMSGSFIFLHYAIERYEQELTTLEVRKQKLDGEKKMVIAEIARLQKLDKLREKISTKNRLQKENVKNFFDLVPGGVTLELAEFRDNTLRLKGFTQNKEQFNTSFQLLLASRFSRSTTTFTKLKDGSYRFNNISIMEEE